MCSQKLPSECPRVGRLGINPLDLVIHTPKIFGWPRATGDTAQTTERQKYGRWQQVPACEVKVSKKHGRVTEKFGLKASLGLLCFPEEGKCCGYPAVPVPASAQPCYRQVGSCHGGNFWTADQSQEAIVEPQSVWRTGFPMHLLFISKLNQGYM